MSLSQLYPQKYLVQVEILGQLLKRFIDARNQVITQEDKLLLEHNAIALFEKLLELKFELKQVEIGEYLSSQDIFETYGEYETLSTVAFLKLDKLIEIFLNHYNITQQQLVSLSGKIRRIKQKQSALKMWTSSEIKFLVAESFLNIDNLDNSFGSAQSCTVHSGSGILTLPVKNRKLLTVKKINISGGSNGVPGNSDVAVTTNNTDILNVLTNDPNMWFEYERLDSGPLKLNIVLEFAKEEIVNFIRLVPVSGHSSIAGTVDDIVFSTSSAESVSVKKLIGQDLEKGFWDIRTVSSEGWSLPFSPILTKTVTIRIKQNESHLIKTSNLLAKKYRNRYAIGLKLIETGRITYANSGSINSTKIDLPNNLYLGKSLINIYPDDQTLYEAILDTSQNAGESWSSSKNNVLLESNTESFMWRLLLTRKDEVLKQMGSTFVTQAQQKKVSSLLKSVSTANSPYSLALPNKASGNSVFVMQSKMASRGPKNKRTLLGVGSGTSMSLDLPFQVIGNLKPEELHVYVAGKEYTYTADNTAIGADEWSLSDDFREIEFSDSLPTSTKIEIVFDEETMEFQQLADGYYHSMALLFDPDKESIEITALPTIASKASVTIPRDVKVFPLGYKNILSDSFLVSSKEGLSYLEVDSRSEVITTEDAFYVDYKNGILWLNAPTDQDTIRVSFDHLTGEILKKDDYDIVYGNDIAMPVGIRIPLDKFLCMSYTDTIGDAASKIINIKTGLYAERSSNITNNVNTKSLSSDNIIKGSLTVSSDLFAGGYIPEEIDFIDGISEFYGLIHVEDERTTAIESETSTVTFNLAAGALWYSGLGVHFGNTTIFSELVSDLDEVDSAGKYFIGDDGTVTVYGSSLPAGITISYYYKDSDFDSTNKYSVNYQNGILYTVSDLANDATVKYKVASYKVAYSIGKAVTKYEYNPISNSVAIRTEDLHSVNNLIRVVWEHALEPVSLIDLTEYFSPAISMLAFRFI